MIIFVLALCFLGVALGDSAGDPRVIEIEDYVEGWYWRDFTGEVPRDALPGGEVNGQKTYIGQTLYSKYLIPGEIRSSDNRIHFEYSNSAEIGTNNIMILCTQNPEQFEWVKTTKAHYQSLLKKRNVIEGGYENKPYQIGRIVVEDQKIVGKITNDAIGVSQNGQGKRFESFEALVFNPNVAIRDIKKKSKKTVRITINQ